MVPLRRTHRTTCILPLSSQAAPYTAKMTKSIETTSARPVNVMFVCLGNICRSTMAEGVFRNMVASSNSPLVGEIDSSGTGAYHAGDSPDSRTMSTLRRHGIKNYSHYAQKITKEDFLKFDYLLAMDEWNLSDLLEVRESMLTSSRKSGTVPAAKVAEVRLFGDFGPGGKLHDNVGGGETVRDPYYGGANGFEEVYHQVTRFSKNFLDYLEKQKSTATAE
ncbi:hypothetical protein MAP00_005241 [Monascus purpureus]|nr:hypothetical protein MAP00_005241 [Monascus purpureus]